MMYERLCSCPRVTHVPGMELVCCAPRAAHICLVMTLICPNYGGKPVLLTFALSPCLSVSSPTLFFFFCCSLFLSFPLFPYLLFLSPSLPLSLSLSLGASLSLSLSPLQNEKPSLPSQAPLGRVRDKPEIGPQAEVQLVILRA